MRTATPRWSFALLSTALAASALLGAPTADAAPVTGIVGGIYWSADSDDVAAGATITTYAPALVGDSIIVPETVTDGADTFVVRAIGPYALAGPGRGSGGYSSIDLPDTITTIGDHAFSGTDFASIDLPASLTTVGADAFGYSAVTSIVFPDSVTSIGAGAFWQSLLTSVTLPNGITSISQNAFRESKLTSLTIPPSVTTIGEAAFAINELTELVIPSTVTSLAPDSFSVNKLTSLTIPDSITELPFGVFAMNELTSVTIPASVTTIGEVAFGYNQLASITIPDTVTSLGPGAFMVNKLTSAVVGEGVTDIADNAFWDNDLTSITLGSAVTRIGEQAFTHNELVRVTIPATVTEIARAAFVFNPLCTATLLGPAPTVVPFTGNASAYSASFGYGGAESGARIYFTAEHADTYTTPTWQGFQSRALSGEPDEVLSCVPQEVDFGTEPPDPAAVGGTYDLEGSAWSGQEVVFSSDTPDVCTVSGAVATFVAVGTCVLRVDQAGDGTWDPATSTQSFAVIAGSGPPAKASQTITFTSDEPLDATVGGTHEAAATATSGLPVAFSSASPSVCSVSGTTVTYLGVGTCVVRADQAGDAQWAAAPFVIQSFEVAAGKEEPGPEPGSQAIEFTSVPPASALVGGTYVVAATATSGLPVAFSSTTPSACTVSGSTVSFVGVGPCAVRADQTGDDTWDPAPFAIQSFTVAAPVEVTPTTETPTTVTTVTPTTVTPTTVTTVAPTPGAVPTALAASPTTPTTAATQVLGVVLSRTGGDTGPLVRLAALLLLAGVAVVVAGRRRVSR